MNALKQLSELDLNQKRLKYKNVPDFALPKTKFNVHSANGLTKSILSWLELNGHYCSRIQSQGQYNPTLQRWTKSTVKRGIADIMAVINGRTVMIEVKAGNDRLSKYQIETQKEVQESGGIYFVAKDFDSFMTFYKTEFSKINL